MRSTQMPSGLGNGSNGRSRGSAIVDNGFQVILSFDVEEHYQIEAARGLAISPGLIAIYRGRLEPSVNWILEQLHLAGAKATFFVVGELARRQTKLIQAIHREGHEVASHGWDHQPVTLQTPAHFRADVMRSKDALEQVTGEPVVGYRAPTFSILRETFWAIDILADLGMRYDSSIYPVRHDRYGDSTAPRVPFLARGSNGSLLEFPPATLRLLGMNVPVGGGGSFRLFPHCFLQHGLKQICKMGEPQTAVLYFHPWEFDPDQPRLALARLARFRTYVGIDSNRKRMRKLLTRYRFARAVDVAQRLAMPSSALLVRHDLAHPMIRARHRVGSERVNLSEEIDVNPPIQLSR
jgi:polysaccharide deacetylase family protein (PEP-CTERM system associated)